MFNNSAHRKVLRIMGRGRDSPTNNKEPEYEYGSVPKHLRDVCLVKKDAYLIRNSANVFKELVKSTHGKNNSFRIFSLKELQKATNNFSTVPISSDPYIGTSTYRGTIEDRHVAVKIPRFHTLVNEVVSLSLIKHRNVVKLLGCCLETKRIILVHELPPNGTFERHIFHEKHIPSPLEVLWTGRLRIATEIADAVAYLHSELHMTHGSLWHPEAIILDEFHSAKLGVFDDSTIQNQVESSDVETDMRNKFRKRNDVYHFGKILLNLLGILTDIRKNFRKRYDKVEILKYLKLNVSEKEMPQIEAYIDLFLRCQSADKVPWEEDGEYKVPSMEEVVRELRRIRFLQIKHTDY